MLFGHQNDDTNQTAQDTPTPLAPPPSAPGVNPLAVDPDTGVSLPSAPAHSLEHSDEPENSTLDQPNTTPVDTASSFAPEPTSAASAVAPANSTPADSEGLLGLKQQVLTQLSPLVSHLEQSPEEQFRTTMMLIQSTDNQALLQDAYDTAQKITDDKVRAQALLDVVNEINYFTQQK